jgi:DNA-binding MarR family transcriptional regulator
MQRRTLSEAIVRVTRLLVAGSVLANHRMAQALDVNATDLQVLNIIDLFGPITPKDLAKRSGLSTAGVTVALDRLEAARFVERTPNPEDRRSLFVRPLRRPAHAAYDEVARQMMALLDTYPSRDLAILLGFLEKAVAIEPRPVHSAKQRPRKLTGRAVDAGRTRGQK